MFHTAEVVFVSTLQSQTSAYLIVCVLSVARIDAVFNTWKNLRFGDVLTEGGVNKIAAVWTHSSVPPLVE